MMEERITKEDLEIKSKRVNEYLKKINLIPAYRYDYTAIDITDKTGRMIDTLIAGLTKREAFDILSSIENVLRREKEEKLSEVL
jgi:hypothetical protein